MLSFILALVGLAQGSGFISALPSRIISNKYLLKPTCRTEDVEWGYAFDVHLNAFFPLLIILHVFQLFFYPGNIASLYHLCPTNSKTLLLWARALHGHSNGSLHLSPTRSGLKTLRSGLTWAQLRWGVLHSALKYPWPSQGTLHSWPPGAQTPEAKSDVAWIILSTQADQARTSCSMASYIKPSKCYKQDRIALGESHLFLHT